MIVRIKADFSLILLFICLLVFNPQANVYAATNAAVISTVGQYEQPFSANSLWNSRPVNPKFSTYQIPKSVYSPAVQEGNFSTGFFLAKSSDRPMIVRGHADSKGLWDVDAESFRSDVTIPHWPADVIPAAGGDGHADIVDPITGVIYSFYQLRNVGGQWTATQFAWTALNGRGWGDPAHYFQGSRATGVPAGAGIIRKHELNDGDVMYSHALAMSLTYNALSNSPEFIFPATAADHNASTTNSGEIPEGALLMLPDTFNIALLKTPVLKKIAMTLKTYGAYVVDRNYGTPYLIYVENGSGYKGTWNSLTAADLELIRQALRQVTSTSGWIDANDKSFVPQQNLNMLSMRGAWQIKSGGELGVFDTFQQAVVFGSTTAPVTQINTSGRGVSHTSWAMPQKGKYYMLRAITTGGAKLRLQIFDKQLNQFTFDSKELINGQSITFLWPSENYQPAVTVISGVGSSSTVSGSLTEVLK